MDGTRRKDRKEDVEEEQESDTDSELDIEATHLGDPVESLKERDSSVVSFNPYLTQSAWQQRSTNLHTMLMAQQDEDKYSNGLNFGSGVIHSSFNNLVMK